MSGTARTPLAQPAAGPSFTPKAVEIYLKMKRLRCTCPPPRPGILRPTCAACEKFYALLTELDPEVAHKPWESRRLDRTPDHGGIPLE